MNCPKCGVKLKVHHKSVLEIDPTPDPTPTPTPVPTPTPTPTPVPTPVPSTKVPLAYKVRTDRNVAAKPPVPTLGPAGFSFTDQTFGTRIVRATDALTRPLMPNRSYRVPSSAHATAWNANSTMFVVTSNDGSSILHDFDPVTMTVKKHTNSSDSDIRSYVEPQFSLSDPNIMYGAGGYNGRTVLKFNLATGVTDTVIDLDTLTGLPSSLTDTYVSSVHLGGVSDERIVILFGGTGTDAHRYVLVITLSTGAHQLIDTIARLGFHLHSSFIDLSGRYVSLYPSGADRAANATITQNNIWDTTSDLVTPMTDAMHPAGHDSWGYGVAINQDCCTSCAWDAAQWQFRSLANPAKTYDLIVPTLPMDPSVQKELYLADHTSWRNAQPDVAAPILSSLYRFVPNTGVPWRAWDDEIVAIETTTPGQPGRVWRFAHHRSDVGTDNNPAQPYFWYEPMANIAPNGKWAIFTSNWEKTLGTDIENTARQDVFVLELPV